MDAMTNPTCGRCLQVYGKDAVFDADRLIDLLTAFEDFSVASRSARGEMDVPPPRPGSVFRLPHVPEAPQSASGAPQHNKMIS